MTAPSGDRPGPGPQPELRKFSRQGVALTSRGWGLVALAVLSTVAADILGIQELYPVAAAAVVLAGGAVVWAWTRRWRIDAGRRLQPDRIEAGGSALVVITLHNRAERASPVLTLRDPFDGGRRTMTLTVAPIGPQERMSGSYRLPPAGRGFFTLGPFALEASDPLGLARRTRSSTVVATSIVHPRVERLRAPRVATGSDRDRGTALPISGQGHDEFASLREYRLGDDLRRMHWVSTARTDTLMVREDQLERRGQFSVVLDTRGESWWAAGFERAVSAAASIASAAIEAGLQARVLSTGGLDSGTGAGRTHRSRVLDLLAEIETDRRRPDDERHPTLRRLQLPAGGTVVIVTSDTADTDELRRMAGVGSRTDLILVIIDRSTSDAPRGSQGIIRRPGSTGRVVRVGPDTPLARVWDTIA